MPAASMAKTPTTDVTLSETQPCRALRAEANGTPIHVKNTITLRTLMALQSGLTTKAPWY